MWLRTRIQVGVTDVSHPRGRRVPKGYCHKTKRSRKSALFLKIDIHEISCIPWNNLLKVLGGDIMSFRLKEDTRH